MREPAFRDYAPLKAGLVADGWLTPDTYSKNFAPAEKAPAVYLFLMFRRGEFDAALPAYVGMSTNLLQRWNNHEILTLIDKPDFWVMRWFKPVKKEFLRRTEARYITQFDPPWNVIGRPRGVLMQ